MVVNRFDALASFLSTTTFGGVGRQLRVPVDPEQHRVHAGQAQSRDLARAISLGPGANATWWLCWDEPAAGAPGDQDFDDLVVMCESVNPTPVSKTSWGSLKTRFR